MPVMKKPYGRDGQILTVGLLRFAGALVAQAPDSNLCVRGFDSHRPCLKPQWELLLPLRLQTRTTEAVESDNSILRSSACPYKEGRADEPTRTARLRAC